MRKKYYIYYPRNFSNWYYLLSVMGNDEESMIHDLIEIACEIPGAECHRICRKDAERMAARNRKAYRTGEASSQNPAGATSIISISEFMELRR